MPFTKKGFSHWQASQMLLFAMSMQQSGGKRPGDWKVFIKLKSLINAQKSCVDSPATPFYTWVYM